MLYAIHNENGEIWQANKVFDQPDYAKLLSDLGHDHVAVNHPSVLSPDQWFVDVKAKEITERPLMPIDVNKTKIKAGGDDSALFTGIPAAARFDVTAAGSSIHSGLMDGTELELHIPVPCAYTVKFTLWPFRDFTIEIGAY